MATIPLSQQTKSMAREEGKVKNIWDLSLEAAKEASASGPNESSLVFIGSKGGGKSHLIYRLVDRTDTPKPTLALEYLFTRRLRPNTSILDVCNVYELGSGTIFTNLLDTLISRDQLLSLTVILVIDLSQLNEITTTLDTLTECLREKVESFLAKDKNRTLKESLRQRSRDRIGSDHEDFSTIIPYPLPLIIIGSKYDKFQEVDSESKKLITTYLRLFAHSIGASLYYSSVKSESSMNKSKNILIKAAFDSHLVLNQGDNFLNYGSSVQSQNQLAQSQNQLAQSQNQLVQSQNQLVQSQNQLVHDETIQGPILDYHKPLSIPYGRDSYQLIGTSSLEKMKKEVTSRFPQTSNGLVIPDNPGRDPKFAERDIDLIRSQRDQELEVFRGRVMDRLDLDE